MANFYQITVRPVTRYIVVEYMEDGEPNGCRGGSECGEFGSDRIAQEMAAGRGAWRREQDPQAAVEVVEGVCCPPDHPIDAERMPEVFGQAPE